MMLKVYFNRKSSLNNPHHLLHPAPPLPPPSKSLLETCSFAYCRSGWPHSAAQFFKKMKHHKLRPNLSTLNTLLSSLVKKNPSTHSTHFCQELCNDAVMLGVSSSVVTFNILISGYYLEYKFKDAFELLRKMEDDFQCNPDNATYNTILDAMSKKGRLHDIHDLLLDMKNKGLFPNRNTYNILNTLINGCFEAKKNSEAFKLADEMKDKGVQPNEVTNNILIKWYCKEGGSKKPANCLKMDTVTLNTALHDLCSKRKLQDAYELLSSANKRGYILDEVSYVTLIEKEIIPTIITYNSVIGGLCKLGKTDLAITKLNELLENGLVPAGKETMVEKSFKPDIYTCNILLRGLCREGMLEKATKLFNTWVSKGKVLDAVKHNTLITALCKEGRLEHSLNLVAEMEEKILGPDSYTFNAIIGALNDAGKTKEAEELLPKMFGSLFPTYKNVVAASEPSNESNSSSKDITVNKSTYVTLLNGFIKRRKSILKPD
ncbi:hypothetical protein CDL12_28235 [Handroanthus impetiginosus]|uniref:Pentacotripeptide-repeat region of PRORP domain-containing protein n=1 Tax=Handroanthus impetiginosus TaxID=429701 RepID=A0A2G9G1S4_9LAMI|nr:hypothetical protein CDL12_28235 [Handroanthus impetiginosus]